MCNIICAIYTRSVQTPSPRFFDGIQYLSLPNESVLSRINQEEQMFAERRKLQLLQLRLRLVVDETTLRVVYDNHNRREFNYPVIKYLSAESLIRDNVCMI